MPKYRMVREERKRIEIEFEVAGDGEARTKAAEIGANSAGGLWAIQGKLDVIETTYQLLNEHGVSVLDNKKNGE